METIKQGILGGFSGKVGTVIGSSWKGISYMRGRAQGVKNPRTEGQVEQRSKFALTLDFLKPITAYVRTGYKNLCQQTDGFQRRNVLHCEERCQRCISKLCTRLLACACVTWKPHATIHAYC